MDQNIPFWQKASRPFHEQADQYDQWFEESSLLFRIELDALQKLECPLEAPMLEIGVGPGRFAEALHIGLGIDPAFAPLEKAAQRGVAACQAVGEFLPIQTGRLGTVFLLFTLCFLARPQEVFAECRRVLKPNGRVVLGIVPASSPWGKLLHAKKEEGHPFYQHARFYEVSLAMQWLAECGFEIVEERSTLRQPPDSLKDFEPSSPETHDSAGFVVLVAKKRA